MPDKYVTFQLKKDVFAKLMKGVTTLNLPDIAVKGDGKDISIVATDKKTPSSNDYSIVVGETDKTFCAYYKTENFKMIQDDYDVAISSQKISHFINRNKPIQYWLLSSQIVNFNYETSEDYIMSEYLWVEKIPSKKDKRLYFK